MSAINLGLKRLRNGINVTFVSVSNCFRNFNNLPTDIPEVSKTLIKKTLKTNNVNFEEGFTCFIAPCLLCHKCNKNAKLYINKTTGFFSCNICMRTGEWNILETSFKNKKAKKLLLQENSDSTSEREKLDNLLKEIQSTTNDVRNIDEEAFQRILKKFKLPNVSKTVFEHLDVKLNDKQTEIYFPLENAESQVIGYRKLHSRSIEATTLPDTSCGGVLTAKAVKNKDTAVLIPNISDLLILANSKINANIVCLPNGVNNIPLYTLPSFERFKKLVLWLDNDNKSWMASRSFAKKLGEKRCQLIRPTDKQLLPHLDPDQDFKSIISSAQPMWHKSVTTFSALRADVLSDLRNIDKVQGVKWKRYPTLNKILKGHRNGELTVFTGPTGCGKTTFISDYSLDLSMQGVNTLWGSFEIRNARLAKTMLQQLSGIPLDENLDLFDHWADEFEKLPIYFMTFHGQQSIKVVMEAIEHATYVYDISHVIIDNLQFMMGTSEDQRHMDRFWKQDVIISSFREFATRRNCHVTLVIHPRKERDDDELTTSSIFGGAKASQEADNILIIQDKRLSSIRGKKYLQVVKNRYSGDLGIIPLNFDKSSLSFQQKKIKEKSAEPLDVFNSSNTPNHEDTTS
ncbi:unnamed protein product [Phyllotreta striolata]|uniref:DNA 5'-3' helicase n=1 Tax=Phyllotreta striolata TaxID=444603 RepID=A0A9N9TX16_PHYSR|nr:unnamed protein product [Phyllotreta striolata]